MQAIFIWEHLWKKQMQTNVEYTCLKKKNNTYMDLIDLFPLLVTEHVWHLLALSGETRDSNIHGHAWKMHILQE